MPKSLVLDLILAPWTQIWAPKFFCEFYVYLMVKIVARYYCIQFQGKLMNQNWENGKNLSFGPNWAIWLKFMPRNSFFFFKNLASSVTRYQCQLPAFTISKKLVIQSWENSVMDGRTDVQNDGQKDRRTSVIS